MIKTVGLFMAAVSLLAGCVSVGGPTAAPSAASAPPSFGITTPAPATPTSVAPTPTAVPTPTPTEEPSATPTAEPTESPAAVVDHLLFDDTLDDPGSGWSEFDGPDSSAGYIDGALRIQVEQGAGAAFSVRELGAEYGVVLAAAEFNLAGNGAIAVMCSTDDGSLYGALVGTRGGSASGVIFFSIEVGSISVLERRDVDVEVAAQESVLLGLECAGTSTGAFRLVPVMSEGGPLAVYQAVEGPESFTGVAVYGEPRQEDLTVDINRAAAYGIVGSTDGMTPEGEELLSHVPGDWQQMCTESPVTEGGVAIIHCFLQVEGVGAELAQYQSFASNELMDGAYQERVDQYGVEPTDSCESGPNETTWSIGPDSFGRIQCAPQQVGIRFDWTDDRLSILSTLIDFDGDYENTYQLWLDAGPNP